MFHKNINLLFLVLRLSKVWGDKSVKKSKYEPSKPASSVCFDSTKAARRSTTKAAENFLTTTTWSQSTVLPRYGIDKFVQCDFTPRSRREEIFGCFSSATAHCFSRFKTN